MCVYTFYDWDLDVYYLIYLHGKTNPYDIREIYALSFHFIKSRKKERERRRETMGYRATAAATHICALYS